MSQNSAKAKPHVPRSNKLFEERGLVKKIEYQINLSTSRNPDFVVRHPNEIKERNQDWKKEITKRVTNECNTHKKLRNARIAKATGERRT